MTKLLSLLLIPFTLLLSACATNSQRDEALASATMMELQGVFGPVTDWTPQEKIAYLNLLEQRRQTAEQRRQSAIQAYEAIVSQSQNVYKPVDITPTYQQLHPLGR
jgi:hypothetical protein